jgi:hypothetical protein
LKSSEGEPKVGLLKNLLCISKAKGSFRLHQISKETMMLCISKAKGSFRLHQISKETMNMVVDHSLMDTAES